MKILHVDNGREMRGGQHQALLLMKTLRDAGHECELAARDAGRLWAAASVAGFAVNSATKRFLWTRSSKFDIVHAHDAGAHTLCAVASRRPFVVARRVAFAVKQGRASQWKYRQADRYIAVSQFVAKELESAGIAPEKISVVYDAVDVARATGNWDDTAPAIALASNDPEKGRDLIEAAAVQCGIQVVYAHDLIEGLRRASMFIYATRSEGLGSAALVAMQMGIPVIASRVGGLGEVFEDGVSGIYVQNDAAEIARAMRKILSSPAQTRTLIQNAYRRIDALFTPEQMLAGTLEAYRKALL